MRWGSGGCELPAGVRPGRPMSQPPARVSARDGRRVGRRLTARLAFSGLRRVDIAFLRLKSWSTAPRGYSHCAKLAGAFGRNSKRETKFASTSIETWTGPKSQPHRYGQFAILDKKGFSRREPQCHPSNGYFSLAPLEGSKNSKSAATRREYSFTYCMRGIAMVVRTDNLAKIGEISGNCR